MIIERRALTFIVASAVHRTFQLSQYKYRYTAKIFTQYSPTHRTIANATHFLK